MQARTHARSLARAAHPTPADGPGRAAQVLAIAQREAGALNVVNCVTALGRLAKLAPPGQQGPAASAGAAALIDRAAECFDGEQCQPRHVAQALWACAKLGVVPPRLLGAVTTRAGAMQPSWFKPQEVSMTVWAVGKLAGMRAGDEGGALAGLVARLLPSALAPRWAL